MWYVCIFLDVLQNKLVFCMFVKTLLSYKTWTYFVYDIYLFFGTSNSILPPIATISSSIFFSRKHSCSLLTSKKTGDSNSITLINNPIGFRNRLALQTLVALLRIQIFSNKRIPIRDQMHVNSLNLNPNLNPLGFVKYTHHTWCI